LKYPRFGERLLTNPTTNLPRRLLSAHRDAPPSSVMNVRRFRLIRSPRRRGRAASVGISNSDRLEPLSEGLKKLAKNIFAHRQI
jgi:hypothetical protein